MTEKGPSTTVEVTLPLDLLEDLERFMGERAWTLRQRPTSEREWYAVPVVTECAPNACQQKTCDLFASYRGPCGGCCRCLGFCLNVAHIVHQSALTPCNTEGTLRTRKGYETVACDRPTGHDGDHTAWHDGSVSMWPGKGS